MARGEGEEVSRATKVGSGGRKATRLMGPTPVRGACPHHTNTLRTFHLRVVSEISLNSSNLFHSSNNPSRSSPLICPSSDQGIPQSISGPMANPNNSWGINQSSQAAVLAQSMNRIQKQNELRNELMSTRNMLTMTINSGPQPGSIPMEQLLQKEQQLESQLFQLSNLNIQ